MKLYTKTICPKCIGIKSLIEEHQVAVDVVNIDHDQNAKQALTEANIQTVPALEVDGTFITDQQAIATKLQESAS